MLAAIATLAASVCLPPAGSGTCVPVGSALGLVALVMLGIGLLGMVGAAGVIVARYQRGERDIPALLARPIQTLVSAAVTSLIGIAVLGLLLPVR